MKNALIFSVQGQKDHWNALHAKGVLSHFSQNPSAFAVEVSEILSPNSKILELGCGIGNDSSFFASEGHRVLATDFSDVAINKNKELYEEKNLELEVLDIEKPTPFKNRTFDVIYARLSLHYFSDETTKKIIEELARILKPNGLLCFICKSTKDPLYGKGEKIEEDMYQLNGHVRHFFSEEYVKDLLSGNFTIEKIESGEEKFYDDPAAFVKVIARNNQV